MSNSPNKFVGNLLTSATSGILGVLGARPRGRGRGQRLKALEERVSALEGEDSPTTQAVNAAQSAKSGYVQGTVPPGTSNAAGALNNSIAIKTAADNNALSSDPIQGLENMQKKIAAPGPLTAESEELSQLFNNINY